MIKYPPIKKNAAIAITQQRPDPQYTQKVTTHQCTSFLKNLHSGKLTRMIQRLQKPSSERILYTVLSLSFGQFTQCYKATKTKTYGASIMSKTAQDPTRPTCINLGCSEPVVYSHRSSTGIPRYRIHCSHCQRASYRRHPHRPGVTPYKRGRCVNSDGRLGFPCPTRFELLPNWATGTTEVDHIDGDRNNNNPGNLQELCPLCHQLKGQQNRDFARRLTKHTVVLQLTHGS